MFHFIKYLLLTLFLFTLLALFQSNFATTVSLRFSLPFVTEWTSAPVSINYLLMSAFCMGILFSGLVGALRMKKVRAEKRALKKMKAEFQERQIDTLPAMNPQDASKSEQLPSLME